MKREDVILKKYVEKGRLEKWYPGIVEAAKKSSCGWGGGCCDGVSDYDCNHWIMEWWTWRESEHYLASLRLQYDTRALSSAKGN